MNGNSVSDRWQWHMKVVPIKIKANRSFVRCLFKEYWNAICSSYIVEVVWRFDK